MIDGGRDGLMLVLFLLIKELCPKGRPHTHKCVSFNPLHVGLAACNGSLVEFCKNLVESWRVRQMIWQAFNHGTNTNDLASLQPRHQHK